METDTTGNMDIVFLDVEMLGISGIETARILRERDSRVILIFVSCYNPVSYTHLTLPTKA